MSEIEVLLNEHLRPAYAPRELRDRVRAGREASIRAANSWAWVAAAAVLVVASAMGVHTQLRNPAVKQPVQAWVKSSTGLDLHGACGLCHID